jgi:DNA-binding PadR family transcriptional regulator
MRRKPDSLLPIEVAILQGGLAMRAGGAAEFHGYAVAKEMREHAEARRLTAHGTLYRALERLEQRSLLESRLEDPEAASAENRPRRRLYTVTALGVAAVQSAPRPERAPGGAHSQPGAAS